MYTKALEKEFYSSGIIWAEPRVRICMVLMKLSPVVLGLSITSKTKLLRLSLIIRKCNKQANIKRFMKK